MVLIVLASLCLFLSLYCSPESLGEYLKARGWDSASRLGQRLDQVLSPSHSEAGKEDVLAAAESVVKGSAEAREELRGFSCTASIGWVAVGSAKGSEADVMSTNTSSEQGRILKKDEDADSLVSHPGVKSCFLTNHEERDRQGLSRGGQSEDEGGAPEVSTGDEGAGSSMLESNMEEAVASVIEVSTRSRRLFYFRETMSKLGCCAESDALGPLRRSGCQEGTARVARPRRSTDRRAP